MSGIQPPSSSAMSPWYTRAEFRGMVHPEGLVNSHGAGRTDIHSINVPAGSYVVPADVTSGLGEGNTLAGAGVMDRVMHSNPYGMKIQKGGGGAMHPPKANIKLASGGQAQGNHHKLVPIVVAGGELIYHPHTIENKFGNLKKGHAAMDQFVRKARAENIKTLRKLPGPKK